MSCIISLQQEIQFLPPACFILVGVRVTQWRAQDFNLDRGEIYQKVYTLSLS